MKPNHVTQNKDRLSSSDIDGRCAIRNTREAPASSDTRSSLVKTQQRAQDVLEHKRHHQADQDDGQHHQEMWKKFGDHVDEVVVSLLQGLHDGLSHDFTSTFAFHLSLKYGFCSSNSPQSISFAASISFGEESACSTR